MQKLTLRERRDNEGLKDLEEFRQAVLAEINRLRRWDGQHNPAEASTQATIIYHRYIKGEKWVRVERICYYRERQGRTICNRGLDRLARAFETNPTIQAYLTTKAEGEKMKSN